MLGYMYVACLTKRVYAACLTDTSQVVEVHTLSGYEKSVMTVNDWIKTHGYEPFAEIVDEAAADPISQS